ncbi:MAG TPA: GAF domain-containing SpoIIE family protein phosphatase [Micromonosporaceae bacterium]
MSGAVTQEGGERLRQLLALTDAALSRYDVEELLAELVARTRDLMGTDTAAILLLDPSGRELVATAASGLEEEVRQGVRVPVGEGFAGTIAATGQPLVLDHIDRSTVSNRILIDENLIVMAGVPISASGRLLGVLHVGSRAPRRFGDHEIELLRLVADRAGVAAQARISRLERQTTVALQRSLLPARPPEIDGFDVAARYVPGAEVGIGGDWYDLFALPSGHVGVVIGDVAGNGLRAAVVMGRMRSALRSYALETTDPADVLTRLDRKIQFFEPNAMATVSYAVIDPERTTITVSLAGHLAPIMLDAEGNPWPMDAVVDFPVGAYPEPPRRSTTTALPHALLFYTDGLVERRGRPIGAGIANLLAVLGRGSADDLCAHAMTLLHREPATDDIALIALRRTT